MKAGSLLMVVAVTSCSLLAACSKQKQDCICTTELRVNYCVTVNGSREIPDSLVVVRERAGKLDTLKSGEEASGNCLYEFAGKSSVFVYKKDGGLLKEIKGVKTKTVDCCHGEPKTVDIALQNP
jgi:hypothetical protein